MRGCLALFALPLMTAPLLAQTKILTPGGTVNGTALGYGPKDGVWQPVTATTPLPVSATPTQAAATSAPLSGTSATTQTVGPFAPQLGRPINLTLSGTWTGSAQLLRSIDAGATKVPITIGGAAWASYSGNVNEPVWTETEANATYYLSLTVSSGALAYRVAQ